ncbi:hypothetical protein HNP89_001964 [Methanococcus maripaludis]|uniref:Uncharacterized protein n=1 Tax=Methanococcus maripaludis TaxID=39152 RepID=A0A7J9P794_METMI|nr:hypothetical protein [Methanococcus maripaludis]MBA2853986.1 hypothetical protein [Methanococcus maripaludis]
MSEKVQDILKILTFLILSYIFVCANISISAELLNLLSNISLNCFSIIIGFIIGAVGILVGTLSGIYGSLTDMPKNKHTSETLESLDIFVKELRDNTIFLVLLLIGSLIIEYIKIMPLDFSQLWFMLPSSIQIYFTREIIISTLSLSVLSMGFCIIYGIVSSIFNIYDVRNELLKNGSKNSENLNRRSKNNKRV